MIDQCIVQNDFTHILDELLSGVIEKESFWVRLNDQTYKIKCATNSTKDKVLFTPSTNSIDFKQVSTNKYTLVVNDKTYNIQTPKVHVKGLVPISGKLTALALSPNGENVAIGDSNGGLALGKLVSDEFKLHKTIESAHFADVLKVSFFQSNQVLVTIGLDYTINIWSFVDGSNPRTLRKQKGRLTDLAIVGKGRNILSSSMDGSVALWECGSGECIWQFRRVKGLDDGVTALVIKQVSELANDVSTVQFDRSFQMEGKLLYTGHESGVVGLWDLQHRSPIGEFQSCHDGASVSALCLHDSKLIVGYSNGYVRCFGDQNALVWELQVSDGEIVDLKSADQHQLCVSTASATLLIDTSTPTVGNPVVVVCSHLLSPSLL